MTTYARLTPEGTFQQLVELNAERYAELEASGKAAMLRLWSEDAKPVPTASQVLMDGGIVITPTTATQTWTVREKTQAELDGEENEAEKSDFGR